MPRPAYNDLIAEVRAQIDVDDDTAFAWLLDRSRVLNAETAWLLKASEIAVDGASRYYLLPSDCLWVEAVLYGQMPYQRSTLHQLDSAYAGRVVPPVGIYADGADSNVSSLLQIFPDVSGTLTVRYVADVVEERTQPPPFPPDFDQVLVEGAIALGLARMDERFDSAGYFDERFINGVARLKRRRHGHIGRGATKIRVFG